MCMDTFLIHYLYRYRACAQTVREREREQEAVAAAGAIPPLIALMQNASPDLQATINTRARAHTHTHARTHARTHAQRYVHASPDLEVTGAHEA